MKRSRLSYDEWNCITSKDMRGEKVESEFINGYLNLINIHEVTEPQIWKFNDEDIVVCDKGIKWLTILPRDDFYCITCMMDAQDEILLWYIDMIAGQGIDEDCTPYFDDLYLDLVVYPDGTIVEDDRDELEDALQQKEITEEQYRLAIETAEKLKRDVLHDMRAFISFTRECYKTISRTGKHFFDACTSFEKISEFVKGRNMLNATYNNMIENLPQEIKELVAGQEYTMDNIGKSCSAILMFADKVLKIQPETEETKSECTMLKWLEGKLPVPRILKQINKDGMSYLLMTRMQGKMSCDAELMTEPEIVVSALAKSLKALWEVDITDCPVRWDLDVKLSIAKENVEQGLVDVEDAEPETFGENGFANPQALLDWLLANRPEEELVLSHGDFCMPNIFIEDDKPTGYIDLGRIGIADKWQDIALCYRSLKHNYAGVYGGKVYEDFRPEMLFEKLGMEPDWEKINYYILVDELF